MNSLVAEQYNHEFAAVRYSLCQMNETHFKQTVGVMIDLHNEKINSVLRQKWRPCATHTYLLGYMGCLDCSLLVSFVSICYYITTDMNFIGYKDKKS